MTFHGEYKSLRMPPLEQFKSRDVLVWEDILPYCCPCQRWDIERMPGSSKPHSRYQPEKSCIWRQLLQGRPLETSDQKERWGKSTKVDELISSWENLKPLGEVGSIQSQAFLERRSGHLHASTTSAVESHPVWNVIELEWLVRIGGTTYKLE